MSATKETAPKARQRSEATVGDVRSSTNSRMLHAPSAVNVPVYTFEGHALTVLMRDGRPYFAAAEVSAALGYEPSKLADKVGGEWASEFIEGTDYAVIRGDDARTISQIIREKLSEIEPPETGGPKKGGAHRLLLLTRDGLNLALMKTRKPAGVRMRRWLASEVLPALAQTEVAAPPPASQLPPELAEFITELRREVAAAREDANAYKAENVVLMRLIGTSGKYRAEQLKSIFNETAALLAESQKRQKSSCRTEVESLVRDRVSYPRGASMSLEAMPIPTWELAKIYANQELARARRLHVISKQHTLRLVGA